MQRGAGLALVCAARHPARCHSLTLAGGVPPIISSLPMGGDGTGSYGLLQRNPWFMETYYQILSHHLQAGSGPRLLRYMPRWSQRDAALDERPELLEYLVATSLEAGTRIAASRTACASSSRPGGRSRRPAVTGAPAAQPGRPGLSLERLTEWPAMRTSKRICSTATDRSSPSRKCRRSGFVRGLANGEH